MQIARFFRHIFSGPWRVRQAFPRRSLKAIEAAIRESEHTHLGEVRFVVEGGLEITPLLTSLSARERAIEVFSNLRIWDTEQNNGVLIYLLLADHDVEIVADRGIHAKVGAAGWESVCRAMESRFRHGEFERGVIEGLSAITAMLKLHFPAHQTDNPNELSDAPLVL
jgi:TPM domain